MQRSFRATRNYVVFIFDRLNSFYSILKMTGRRQHTNLGRKACSDRPFCDTKYHNATALSFLGTVNETRDPQCSHDTDRICGRFESSSFHP
jgi:hypothetical protein